jgi:ribosome-binding factor A
LGGIPAGQEEKVWVKETSKVFEKASGFLRSLLAESTHLRHVPKLVFSYDAGPDVCEKMASLLKDIH